MSDRYFIKRKVWYLRFEEISTTHFTDDSVYKDKKINEMKLSQRKTKVNHWGRYEIKEYL